MRIPKPKFLPMAAICAATALAQIRPEAAPTEVLVQTTARAEIFLDQVRLGEAGENGRFVIHNASPGPHTVRVTMSGKSPFTKKIVVTAGNTSQVRAELSDLTGDLEILTTAGAQIMLNGRTVGTADGAGKFLIAGLTEPHYRVRVLLAGFSPEERQIDVASGMVSSVTMELTVKAAANASETTALPPVAPPNYVLKRKLVAGEGSRVDQVFFQADSHVLVSVGQNRYTGNIIQWDPDTGRLLKTLEVKAPYGVRSVSPDLRWAAIVVPKPIPPPGHFDNARASIQLIDTANGSEGRIWPGYSVEFTFDSKRVLISAWQNPEAVLWDIASGKKVGTWPHAGWVQFSPDGHRVATEGSEGITILDVETGKTIQQLPRECGNCGVALSPDERWLAVAADTKVELWDLATRKQSLTFESPALPRSRDGYFASDVYFKSVVFTPDSRQIVSNIESSNYQGAPYTGIWLVDTITGRQLRKWPAKDPGKIELSSDGLWMATLGFDGSLTVWKREQ